MKKILIRACLLGAYAYGPGFVSGQESLLVRTIKGNAGIIYSVAYSPDGKHVASAGVDPIVKIWSVEDGSLAQTLEGNRSFVNALAYSPDGKTLATAAEDGVIKLWDTETGACKRTWSGHREAASSLAFFPDGTRLASAGGDGMLRLWRLKAKTPYKTINTRSGYVYSVAVSSDGTRLASGAAGRTIKLWDAETGARLMTFEGHADGVNSVAFSRTANYLTSGSDDGLVKVWRLSDGICIKTFTGQPRPVNAIAYSPDGNYIISAGGDKQVTAWRVSDSRLEKTFTGHGGQVKSLAFSPDARFIVSGGYDKALKLWLTPWEADRRDREMKENDAREVEKNKNYDLHYSAGVQLLSAPTKENLEKAVLEFTQACSLKKVELCDAKLAEASAALKRKEEQWKRNITLGLTGLAAVIVLAIIITFFTRIRKKANLRETLPLLIRNETLSGNYERAMKYYAEYKSVKGDPKRLPRVEMMELYRGLQALSDLPKEELPYGYLLSYANQIAQEGNHKLAFTMLRSGRLLDEFTLPAEFDNFTDIYLKAGRPEMLFAAKLGPATYSSMAEALFKIGDFDTCGKACSHKKQFYAGQMSPRDTELLGICQKKLAELAEEKKNIKLKWRCINCGHVHEGEHAPESCPGCMHPREHFQVVK